MAGWRADLLADFGGIAYELDAAAAAADCEAELRRDIEGFVSREVVEAVVVTGRRELPPVPGVRYRAFVDPSGGSQDSMTLASAHRDRDRAVLDCVREQRPPFNPSEVVADFTTTLRTCRVRSVVGDAYAGQWPRERFRAHGIRYELAEQRNSDIYVEVLSLVNSGRVELLDQPRLISQLSAADGAGRAGLHRPSAQRPRRREQRGGRGRRAAESGAGALSRSYPRAPIRFSREFVRGWGGRSTTSGGL